jgi:plasmid maintenance system killer protein
VRRCTGKVSVVRLRFNDPGLERLYEDPHAVLQGADVSVTEYFFDALAVLRAARSLADFAELQAFAALPVNGQPAERRAIALGDDWKLVFSVQADEAEGATATIESLRRTPRATRRSG